MSTEQRHTATFRQQRQQHSRVRTAEAPSNPPNGVRQPPRTVRLSDHVDDDSSTVKTPKTANKQRTTLRRFTRRVASNNDATGSGRRRQPKRIDSVHRRSNSVPSAGKLLWRFWKDRATEVATLSAPTVSTVTAEDDEQEAANNREQSSNQVGAAATAKLQRHKALASSKQQQQCQRKMVVTFGGNGNSEEYYETDPITDEPIDPIEVWAAEFRLRQQHRRQLEQQQHLQG